MKTNIYLFIYSALLTTVCALPAVAGASDKLSRAESISQMTAVAKKPALLMPNDKLATLTFDFREIEAWLRTDGSWHLKGSVEHSGLRCATYSVGMRFGVGAPGCSDVKWLTQAKFVTSITQCNNAPMLHEGGDDDVVLKQNYAKISCAERIIKCEGNCK